MRSAGRRHEIGALELAGRNVGHRVGRRSRRALEVDREHPGQLTFVEQRESLEDRLDLRPDVFARTRNRRDAQRSIERIRERAGVGEPLERRARETALQDPDDRAWQHRLGRGAGEDGLSHRMRRVALEGAMSGHQLVRQHAEREHVGRSRRLLGGELLRRAVRDTRRQPRDLERARRPRRGEQPEVGDLDVALDGDEHVGRRKPEVTDAAPVRVPDRARDLRHDRQHPAVRQRDAGVLGLRDQAEGVDARDVLDRGERHAARHAEFAHPRDARVLEAAVGARGARQRLRVLGEHGQLGGEALDRELAFEACDAEHLGARDRAVWTGADQLQDLVAPHALRRCLWLAHPR